jgi:hypothetical protein
VVPRSMPTILLMCGGQFSCKSALINANFSISENEA